MYQQTRRSARHILALLGGTLAIVCPPVSAQDPIVPAGDACGQPVGVACHTRLVTDATYSTRISREGYEENVFGDAPTFNISASIGFVSPIIPRFGVGVVGTVGIWDDFYFSIGPRLRWFASSTMTVDVTPQYIVNRSQPGSGRGVLDVGVMYRDAIGVSLQVGSFQRYRYNADFSETEVFDRTMVMAGLRLGSKPGRWGMLADAVALAGAFALFAAVCGGGGCS